MIYINPDRKFLTQVGEDGLKRVFPVTCLIRDHTNPPDAHPENEKEVEYPQFYQPQPFPLPDPYHPWHVIEIWWNDEPYTAPVFIKTDAHQPVTCLDGSVVEDYGYAFHFSTSPTTWGCLHMASDSDARWLAGLVKIGEEVQSG